MALVRLLGAIDLASAAALGALAAGHAYPAVLAPLALALAIKGLAFPGSVASRIDIICAIGMIALLWMPNPAIAVAIAVYLAIKGVTSFA